MFMLYGVKNIPPQYQQIWTSMLYLKRLPDI